VIFKKIGLNRLRFDRDYGHESVAPLFWPTVCTLAATSYDRVSVCLSVCLSVLTSKSVFYQNGSTDRPVLTHSTHHTVRVVRKFEYLRE